MRPTVVSVRPTSPRTRYAGRAATLFAAALLVACGSGGSAGSGSPPAPVPSPTPSPSPTPAPSFTVGGTVNGLRGASGVMLSLGSEQLTVAVDGQFTFTGTLASGTAYQVAVASQPTSPWQTCTIVNGSGTVSAAVTNVTVTCSTNGYPVGGSVSGLNGAAGLVLRNNGGDDVAVGSDGAFVFPSLVASGGTYQATVANPPTGLLCAIAQSAGTVTDSAVSDIAVTCSPSGYLVGGTVNGLLPQDPAGSGLVLVNNARDQFTVRQDGRFTFTTRVPQGASYTVAVAVQPNAPAQTCVVEPGTGNGGPLTADVDSVRVNCLALNTAGAFDPSFGTAGVVRVDVGDALGIDEQPALVQQADGRLVVAATSIFGTQSDFALVRLNTDGARDRGFDGGRNDGFVRTDLAAGTSTSTDIVRAIGRQRDGRIVVGGYTSTWDFALVRYTADGVLDTSFGSGGVARVNLNTIDYGLALAIDASDRIVVAGTTVNVNENFAVLRFTADGQPDATFNGGDPANTTGGVVTDFNRDDRAQAVAIQADGRIVAAGYAGGAASDFAVARYLPDGSLDTSFGSAGTGKVTTQLGSVDRATAMVIQPDGAILLGGHTGVGALTNFALVRYTSSGTLDPSFDADGIVTTDLAGNDDRLLALALDASGRLIAAGYASNGVNNDVGVVRYLPSGARDTSFGSAGVVVTAIGGGHDRATAVIVQTDGRIVIAGETDNGSTGSQVNVDLAVIRLLP